MDSIPDLNGERRNSKHLFRLSSIEFAPSRLVHNQIQFSAVLCALTTHNFIECSGLSALTLYWRTGGAEGGRGSTGGREEDEKREEEERKISKEDARREREREIEREKWGGQREVFNYTGTHNADFFVRMMW